MLVLDYIASHLNLTWKKNKNWSATVTTTTTIYVDPPKRPKIKQKKEVENNVKQAKKDTNSSEEKNDGIDDKNIVENGNQKKFDDDFRSEEDNVDVGLKSDISKLKIDDESDSDDELSSKQFRRMRIGIGRPPKDIDDRSHDVISSYVLARITSKEMEYYTKEVFPKCKEQLLKI
ncbi:19932_t:CDS:2 [Racocetra fulgida]|uniref:19932_t:CDS:1 n=1 Tax=Racocetra fulgida TaxID=60492 RepID=A0A9N9CMZ9_9GLOM|nr:19932_t:CDS:2 [Racocetra fulgida]